MFNYLAAGLGSRVGPSIAVGRSVGGSSGLPSPLMDATGYVDEVRRSGHRLADATAGRLGDPVPSCPDWTGRDLVEHVSLVLQFWPAVAAGRAKDFSDYPQLDAPGDAELVDWYRAIVDQAVDDLGTADPAGECFNWTGSNQTAAWIQRRMANELAVHAWDAANASGSGAPIGTEIAVDGVDEFLEVFVPLRVEALGGDPTTIHLHATDADGEWMITAGNQTVGVERAHGKGDVAVRAPASDLVLLLWGRTGADGLETFGDQAVLDGFVATMRI
jgi:uncharacterized protein (TIGR03083 family)